MCFNIGVIIGPILGGSLANPVNSFPKVFGPGSIIGGKEGVWWMEHWPYALPNVLSAIYIFSSLLAVFLGLDEVSDTDIGINSPDTNPYLDTRDCPLSR
jgi:hypothetical protein